jgi:uncharacterized protein YidB (DUF937 family)
MSLLDTVLGSQSSPLASVLRALLSGGQASGIGSAETVQGAAGSPGIGGLAGLLQRFESAGLGNLAQSWVGTGANAPVSPAQLEHALGADQILAMAAQTGLSREDLLAHLAQHLPGIIDRLTPGGELPPPSELEAQAVRV